VGGVGCVVDSSQYLFAKSMITANMVVPIVSSAWPPSDDLMIHQSQGVDYCSVIFRCDGRQLYHGESRSPTQLFQSNQRPVAHPFWVCV
jgi:hypothetical protein